MTDKHIIDGVDVSGCIHYKNKSCIADYLLTDMNFSEAKCELCKDCYYKQLKRKEQECKKLKKVSCKFKEYCTCNTEKFLQTLKEIKDIVEPFCYGCQEFEPEKRGINCIYCNYGKILQLIRESEIKHES